MSPELIPGIKVKGLLKVLERIEKTEEVQAIEKFRRLHPDLFQKEDAQLLRHLGTVIFLLFLGTSAAVLVPSIGLKIVLGAVNAFLWFSFINATIHHHHTHHNAARGPFAGRALDILYFISVPNAPKRLSRYTRAHLNHHARPFHETDVDHHYGAEHHLRMKKNLWTRFLYFLELTFVGSHVPGWEDDRYMNQVPLENWNRKDYERVKEEEKNKSRRLALLQWGLFGISVWLLPWLAWGWAFPMLLVKNWAHFLGQFQHYDGRLLDPSRSIWNRTKTYRFPGWLNDLAGGEISGHFLHHLFPEIPYYKVEMARRRFMEDPELRALFITY